MIQRNGICFFIALTLAVYLGAQEEPPERKLSWLNFSGYMKDMQSIGFINEDYPVTLDMLLHNRLNFNIQFCSSFSAHIGMRNRMFIGDMVSNTLGFGEQLEEEDGLIPLSFTWLDKSRAVGNTTFDRLYLEYSCSKADILAGRQRINWGINTIWNPNDIFNAYNYLDFDYEELPGNDAVRLRLFPKDNFTAELAYKPGQTSDDHIGALLFKFNKKNYDFQFLAGVSHRDLVGGMGFAGNMGNAGLKGEATYFHPLNTFGDTTGTFSASVMTDYSTKKGWYLSASFLLNLSKAPESFFAPGTFKGELTAKTLTPFRYNFYSGFMKQIIPILNGGVSVLYATKYHTLVIYPTLSYNVAENFDLDLVMQSYLANFPDRYRSQGNAVYLRLRYSFGN